MFSLLITIIAIALVAALALATIYYSNVYAGTSIAKTQATRALQEGNQIVGAFALYRADFEGALPTGTSDEIKAELVSKNYLTSIPSGEWVFRNDYAVRTDMDEAACLNVNKSIGINTVPLCSDAAYAGKSFCCSTE